MLRAAGAGITILASALLGVRAAAQLENSYQELLYLQRLTVMLKGELRYSRTVLSQICARLSGGTREPYREWFAEMAVRLEERRGSSVSSIWSECTQRYLGRSALPPAELERLTGLGRYLETADPETQIDQLTGYQEQLGLSIQDMRTEIREKKKLFCCLGVSGGILLSVLLI